MWREDGEDVGCGDGCRGVRGAGRLARYGAGREGVKPGRSGMFGGCGGPYERSTEMPRRVKAAIAVLHDGIAVISLYLHRMFGRLRQFYGGLPGRWD